MGQLYNLYAKKMYNTSYRLLNDRADAQDAMQEAFIAAWNAFPGFDLSKSPEKWIKTLVINKSIDMLRKRKTYRAELKDVHEIVDQVDGEVYFERYSINDVRNAIMNLTEACRTVLSLYLIEGLDYQEIAEYLSLKESSVRSHASRGFKRVRIELESLKR